MPTISELMKTANSQAEEAKRLNEQTQALQQQQQNITAGANALHARLDALQKPVIGSQVGKSTMDKLSDEMVARAQKSIAEAQGNTTPASNEDYLRGLAETMTPALSQEEIDRRARAMQQRENFGALGNTLNAFANLIAVGQGAENQALPSTPKSEVGTWRDKQEAKLAEYNKAKYLDYRQALEDSWRQREWDNKVAQQEQQQANIEADRERDDKRYQDALAQQQAELAENIRRNKAAEAATNRELSVAEQNAESRKMEAEAAKMRAAGGGASKDVDITLRDASGNNYTIKKEVFDNKEVLANLATKLGISERMVQYSTPQELTNLLSQAIRNGDAGIIKELQDMGYLEVTEVSPYGTARQGQAEVSPYGTTRQGQARGRIVSSNNGNNIDF